MSLTLGDAAIAMRDVLAVYGIYLPSGVKAEVESVGVGGIFHILPEAQYRIQFSSVFNHFFAAANVQAFGLGRVIQPSGQSTVGDCLVHYHGQDAYVGIPCPAFCAPAVQVTHRKIYVNAEDDRTTRGTLYHEFVHYLSHSYFYPEFYAMGGPNPNLLEGVTEFLTRRVSPGVAAERARQRKYQGPFELIDGLIGSNMTKRLQLIRYCFQGEYMDLGGIRPNIG